MAGCHEARNAITIAEVLCPQCSETIEVFVKDGALCADTKCPECGHVVEQSTPIGNLQCD